MTEPGKSDTDRHGPADRRPTGERPRQTSDRFEAFRFAGAGLELAGSSIVFAAIGYALDRHLENETMIATALGAIIGFAAGLFRFIRLAMAANRNSHSDSSSHR